MKIVGLQRSTGPRAMSPLTAPVRLWADSAQVLGGRPVFPSPLAEAWTMRHVKAYRVGRLGRAIEARWALRHIDAVTLVTVFEPAEGFSPQEVSLMDGTMAVGAWMPLAGHEEEAETLGLSQMVKRISLLATLKTGDILVPALDADEPRQVVLDTHVEASLYGMPCLSYNIK